MAKKKPARSVPPKKPAPAKASTKSKSTPKASVTATARADQNGKASAANEESRPRLLPTGDELKSLYSRYTGGAKFDDHDKAFYFVLDVGGISRAKQLLAHVEEVLSELEELH